MIHFSMTAISTGHADPVVPILLALVFLTLAAVFGGRLMTWLKQPPVLGELLAGVFIGNVAYWLANSGITVLREGDTLRRIADLALSSKVSLSDAALRLLPAGPQAERISAILAGAKGVDYVAVYSFIDLLSRVAILLLLFLVGLETNIREMKRVGRAAVSVAVLGVVAPLLLGLATMKFLHPASALARDLFIGNSHSDKRRHHGARASRFTARCDGRGARHPRSRRARRCTQSDRAGYCQCPGPHRRSQRLDHRLDDHQGRTLSGWLSFRRNLDHRAG